MNKLEEIEENIQNVGFKKEDDNRFVFEKVSYNTMNINGKVIKQEVKNTIALEYTGVGGNFDDSDNCLDDMYFFDILENGKLATTVGIYDFQELLEIFGINEKNKSKV